MSNFLKNTLAAAICGGLLLANTLASAQTSPTSKLQPDHYYLDGKPSTKQAVEALNPKNIEHMEVFVGQQAIDYTHDAASKKVVVITTK